MNKRLICLALSLTLTSCSTTFLSFKANAINIIENEEKPKINIGLGGDIVEEDEGNAMRLIVS